MTPLKIQLEDGRQLLCRQLVRLLPGRREVWQGELEGEPVFIKRYLSAKRAQRHWQRELEGVRVFQQHGILTPALRYAGHEQRGGRPLIVSAQIDDAVTLRAAWDAAGAHHRRQLLWDMVALLARHHRAGIYQSDLHLGNFVLSGERIFSLDGDGVRALPAGNGRSVSLDNLALFIAQLPPEWEAQIPALLAHYRAVRGWEQPADGDELRRRVGRARERRWRSWRGKLFRECSAFVCRKRAGRFEVIVRDAFGAALKALLADLDGSFPGREQALKNGNTCTVWATVVAGRRLVVKRYNVKGLLHGLKLSARPGRAMISWENAHRLRFYGIATPSPVAVVRIRRGPLQPVAYFLAEAVDGVDALSWFRDPAIPLPAKRRMAERIDALFLQLKAQRISHGDLKATNILIADGRPLLIDLDAMQQHADEIAFEKAWRRDLRRFLRNWRDDPEIAQLFHLDAEM